MPNVVFRPGRPHAQPARPQLRLRDYLTGALPTPPPTVDWLSGVQSWPMYLNDQIGDCTCAAMGHLIQEFTTAAQGATVTVADQDVLAAYEAAGGYNPADPSTDQGAYIQDALGYWLKNGIAGHTILAYASVDVGNLTEVRQAIDLFGAVNVGLAFPGSAMDQFNAGRPWDVVVGAQVEGGHCVPVGAYGTDGFTCVTWGTPQAMSTRFWQTYVDEAWVVITADWVNAQGLDPQGLNLYQLGQDYAALTGRDNPIPAPQPAPAPEPAPTPAPAPAPEPGPSPAPAPEPQPAPADPDQAMAAAAHAWLDAKGL